MNIALFMGGCLSLIASLLHLAIIVGGSEWYRFFGAGESMALMAEKGAWTPAIVTLFISAVLIVWALYAFSGAGVIRNLPFLKPILWGITTIYLLRGFMIIPLYFIMPKEINSFAVWSSTIVAIVGLVHLWGMLKLIGLPR